MKQAPGAGPSSSSRTRTRSDTPGTCRLSAQRPIRVTLRRDHRRRACHDRTRDEARRTGPGLRVQILLALAGVILVAYVPLFFAIAQVARATSLSYCEESARALGRAVAAHTSDLVRVDPTSVSRMLTSHVGDGGALAIAVYDRDGHVFASAGEGPELAAVHAPSKPYGEATTRTRTRTGKRALDVVLPAGEGAVLVRVRTEEDAARTAGLVRGIAMYMGVFALALLVFAYIALTRAIVKPIEQLARAADQVASGARSFALPPSAASEIGDLGASVRSMATRLRAEEQAMRAKVEELTATTRRLGETREQLAGSERMASVGRVGGRRGARDRQSHRRHHAGMHELLDDTEIDGADRADFLRRMPQGDGAHSRGRSRSCSTTRAWKMAHVRAWCQRRRLEIRERRPSVSWPATRGGRPVSISSRSTSIKVSARTDFTANDLVRRSSLTRCSLESRRRRTGLEIGKAAKNKVSIRAARTGGNRHASRSKRQRPRRSPKRSAVRTSVSLRDDEGIVGAGTGSRPRRMPRNHRGRERRVIYVDPSFTSGARFVIELPRPDGSSSSLSQSGRCATLRALSPVMRSRMADSATTPGWPSAFRPLGRIPRRGGARSRRLRGHARCARSRRQGSAREAVTRGDGPANGLEAYEIGFTRDRWIGALPDRRPVNGVAGWSVMASSDLLARARSARTREARRAARRALSCAQPMNFPTAWPRARNLANELRMLHWPFAR